MEIPFNSDTGLLGAGSEIYSYTEGSLSVEGGGEQKKMPRSWSRATSVYTR